MVKIHPFDKSVAHVKIILELLEKQVAIADGRFPLPCSASHLKFVKFTIFSTTQFLLDFLQVLLCKVLYED